MFPATFGWVPPPAAPPPAPPAGVPADAKSCPWCFRWALKDDACNWVCCGLTSSGFQVGKGCGGQWCFLCSGALCGRLHDPDTGAQRPGVRTSHSATCCQSAPADYNGTIHSPRSWCPGGHNSHK